MATKLKEVDVVVVGLGWTGGILSKELTEAGLKVVALERGGLPSPGKDPDIGGSDEQVSPRMASRPGSIFPSKRAATFAIIVRRRQAIGGGHPWSPDGVFHFRSIRGGGEEPPADVR